MLKIYTYPHKVLSKVSEPVTLIDKKIRRMVDAMVETMDYHKGIGIAAPQIGESKRIAIAKFEGRLIALINPYVISHSDTLIDSVEGCLSVPNYEGIIKRYSSITVTAFNIEGKESTATYHGLLACIILHEIDHLNGKLISDYRRLL